MHIGLWVYLFLASCTSNFLLQHGEMILPPMNVIIFYSASGLKKWLFMLYNHESTRLLISFKNMTMISVANMFIHLLIWSIQLHKENDKENNLYCTIIWINKCCCGPKTRSMAYNMCSITLCLWNGCLCCRFRMLRYSRLSSSKKNFNQMGFLFLQKVPFPIITLLKIILESSILGLQHDIFKNSFLQLFQCVSYAL